MSNQTKKLLFDIATACNEIASFIAGKTRDDYLQDRQLRRAVERDLEIIGEAMSQLRMLDRTTFERIPEASLIIGMRNRLIHAYANVNDQMVWDAATQDVRTLSRVIQSLLHE
jgi:uncharacterized protein with HEPN domain